MTDQMSSQQIRAAALSAAAMYCPRNRYQTKALLTMATEFETYIRDGRSPGSVSDVPDAGDQPASVAYAYRRSPDLSKPGGHAILERRSRMCWRDEPWERLCGYYDLAGNLCGRRPHRLGDVVGRADADPAGATVGLGHGDWLPTTITETHGPEDRP